MQEDKGRQSEKQNKTKDRKKEKSEVGGKQEKEVANMISERTGETQTAVMDRALCSLH